MAEIKIRRKVFSFGQKETPSLAVIIPKQLCKTIGLEIGEELEFDYLDDYSAIIMKRIKKEKEVRKNE